MKHIIIPAIVFTILYFLGTYISLKGILNSLNIPFSKFFYYFPLYMLLIFGLILIITIIINESLFCFFFTLSGYYIGILINSFFTSIFYLLISLIIKIPFLIRITITIITPFLFSIYGFINAKNIKIDNVKIKYPNFSGGRKKICHLTDMHLGGLYRVELSEKIVSKIKEIKPDVIVITGDLSDGSLKLKSEWLNPFNSLSQPILYITGNHEMMHGKNLVLKEIEKTNIKHIGNITYETNKINFIGVDYEYNLRRRLTEIVPQDKNSSIPNVLLCHIPELKPNDLEEYNIFLFLAGHTHGGQIFPFSLLGNLSDICWKGLYEFNGRFVYVSSGVGTAFPPMRTFSDCQISVIEIIG